MAYIFKQKLNLTDLAGLENIKKKILVYQPQEYLASLYIHYLTRHNFDVKHCPNLGELKKSSDNFRPHALIFSLEDEFARPQISWLLNYKKHFPNTVVVTTGLNTGADALKELLSAGVSSHINRRHSRPQDIVVVTKMLLNH